VPPPVNTSAKEKLLLTKEEWMEKYRQEDTGRGGSASGSRGEGRGKPRGRGGRSSSDQRSSSGSGPVSGRVGPDDECKRCGKKAIGPNIAGEN
jgi:hypothetical protein